MAKGRVALQAAALMKAANPAVRSQLATSTALSTFMSNARKGKGELSLKDRQQIVDQAILLLEMTYAHLPLKRAIHAIEPIQRLKLLKFRLSETAEGQPLSEFQFHEEMQEIFTSLRDFHTNYSLPKPFSDKVAFLPFMIEEYYEAKGKERKFMVTHVNPGFEHPTFQIGVEVLYWNGMPIQRAVELNGERQAGSNLEARFAAGLSALTIRPMIGSLPPDENWVVITYRALDGQELEYKQDWLIFTPSPEGDGIDIASGAGLGIDLQRAVINQVRKILFAPEAVAAEKQSGGARATRVALGKSLETTLPGVLRAHPVTTPDGTFAYIRIFNFEASNANAFVNEFIRLLEMLPQNGLILDVRGNGGGYIQNGERLLQLLTPRPIEPELFEFVNSPLNLEICRAGAKSEGLDPWVDSIAKSVMTGATYSSGFALTAKPLCNEIGQRYYGPVLLIIDALCYSTTDMFTAGFQDHAVGEVLGVNGNTGAGGANVWDHAYLVELFKGRRGSPFKRLPKNAGMRVAIRRSLRLGGSPLEELGVIPDQRHYMTKADLLNSNTDLINHAAEMLSKKPVRKISVEIQANSDRTRTITATTEKIARLDLYINDRPQQSLEVTDGTAQFNRVTLAKGARLLLEGFDKKNNLVAVYQRIV